MNLFPKDVSIDILKCRYNEETLYSISRPKAAEFITHFIKKYIDNIKNMIIVDATAHVGGNTINFCKSFQQVIGLEINLDIFKMLEYNLVEVYKKMNIILYNKDCIEFFKTYSNPYNIVFIDPPWGGPHYKNFKNIVLSLSNVCLRTIIEKLLEKKKMIVLKLPLNYQLKSFQPFFYIKEIYYFENKPKFYVLLFR